MLLLPATAFAAPLPMDAGILTTVLDSFLAIFSGGYSALLPHAERLLFLIAAIELTLAALYWALKGDNFIVDAIRKTLVIGTFAYFVLNWPTLINAVLSGFIYAGQTAGTGGGGGAILALTDPSQIISDGLHAVRPITTTIQSLTRGWGFLTNFVSVIQLGWALIFTLMAFFILGIQCFMSYLEFYIVAVLALILVPFGVFRHTAFLAEKSLGVIISHGVKLMVLAFIVSAASPILAEVATALPGTIVQTSQAFSIMLASMAIAFLAWHAPAVAGGMMSGGPSLNAGTAISTAVSAGIGAALGATGAASAARGIASDGAQATLAATRALGAGTTAAQMGAASAAMGGAGALGQAAGAARGVATLAGGAARSAVTTPAGAVAQSFKDAWDSGRLSGYRNTGGVTAAQINRTPPPPPPSAPRATSSAREAMSAIHLAQAAVPPTASPGPGINVPLGGA
ncbi:MAG: type IV secretion system protein [Betaproteobacteria bacterium]|nr:type IV secretion system protein [Betaproteobacteria bacterium]